MIEFDNPKTLDEVLRKAMLCFEQYKQQNDLSKTWKDKKQEKFSQRKKGFKPPPFNNTPRNFQARYYNKNGQPPPKSVKPANMGIKGADGAPKEPLKCWECGEPHLQRNCL